MGTENSASIGHYRSSSETEATWTGPQRPTARSSFILESPKTPPGDTWGRATLPGNLSQMEEFSEGLRAGAQVIGRWPMAGLFEGVRFDEPESLKYEG